MSKKEINQNTNYDSELTNLIGTKFIFNERPINRLRNDSIISSKEETVIKEKKLSQLINEINSIEDCSLKNNSQKLVLGDGNINSSIMLIGEAPGIEESKSGKTFMGDVGDLLKKMLIAINIKKENIYSTYAVNFPLSIEIFLFKLVKASIAELPISIIIFGLIIDMCF